VKVLPPPRGYGSRHQGDFEAPFPWDLMPYLRPVGVKDGCERADKGGVLYQVAWT